MREMVRQQRMQELLLHSLYYIPVDSVLIGYNKFSNTGLLSRRNSTWTGLWHRKVSSAGGSAVFT